MSLSYIKISNFRNLSSVKIDLHEKCNLFYGMNGSGKTSLLEAIYFLGMGRSFRNRLLSRIIQYDVDKFSVFGEINNNEGIITIGIERSENDGEIKIGGEKVSSCSELAKLLPLQLINYNGYKLLEHSRFRRRFIDWGLFHVEHQFLLLWKKLNRLIKQRNAALNSQSISNIAIWDDELVQVSLDIHILREQYINQLIPIINDLIQQFFEILNIEIKYYRGWNADCDLSEILSKNIDKDRNNGFTQFGAHKADLSFKANNISVHDSLSRGQQKVLFCIISLAQGVLFEKLTGKKCIYLIDDFVAELDNDKKEKFASLLIKLNSQIFVTGLNNAELINFFPINLKMFHVERGTINEEILRFLT